LSSGDEVLLGTKSFYSRSENIGTVKIAKPKEPHRTPPKFICGAVLSILTTTIKANMGRRLPDEVVHRIRLRIKANKDIAAIAEAVKVSKKTIYKLQLNLDI